MADISSTKYSKKERYQQIDTDLRYTCSADMEKEAKKEFNTYRVPSRRHVGKTDVKVIYRTTYNVHSEATGRI